jgi:hypothetical protein
MSQELEAFVHAFLRRKAGRDVGPYVTVCRRDGEPGVARFELRFRRGDLAVELNARDGQPLSWSCPAWQRLPPSPADPLALATAVADPPAGAHLAYAEHEVLDGRRVFVARWEHRVDDILVEGDHIQVMIGENGQVFAVHRRWHDIVLEPTPR